MPAAPEVNPPEKYLSWPAAGPGFTTDLRHAPAADTAAVVTLTADADSRNILRQIFWSYSATPTGGSIKVEDGAGTTVWGAFHILTGGIGSVTFDPPLCGTRNTALVVTLATGAGAVVGILCVNAWKET